MLVSEIYSKEDILETDTQYGLVRHRTDYVEGTDFGNTCQRVKHHAGERERHAQAKYIDMNTSRGLPKNVHNY